MAKVHNVVEMWHGSQNLRATQKQSRAQNKQTTAVGYISDTEEIIKASRSNLKHNFPAAFKLSERSPLPPALSAKDHPGGRMQVLNVRQTRRIDFHPTESDKDSSPESISDTENWLHSNADLDNPNKCEDQSEADDESYIEQCSGIEASESPKHWVVSTALNVSGLIRPIR
jgi:hypothetical protein